ncbi:MAG: hypothetical protein U0270_18060 [Labilithrix sp.]
MRSRLLLVIVLGTLAATAALVSACRQEEPVGDPKTPVNSPIPKIDKNEDDPKSAPKLPSLGDAG